MGTVDFLIIFWFSIHINQPLLIFFAGPAAVRCADGGADGGHAAVAARPGAAQHVQLRAAARVRGRAGATAGAAAARLVGQPVGGGAGEPGGALPPPAAPQPGQEQAGARTPAAPIAAPRSRHFQQRAPGTFFFLPSAPFAPRFLSPGCFSSNLNKRCRLFTRRLVREVVCFCIFWPLGASSLPDRKTCFM